MTKKGTTKATGRSYKAETRYNATPKAKKDRAARNAARRKLKASGVSVAGKDVHHKDGNPQNNKRSNLTTMSKSKNRSKK